MSRRQSRVSIDARQNDTLLEFENCASSPRGFPRDPVLTLSAPSPVQSRRNSSLQTSISRSECCLSDIDRDVGVLAAASDMWLDRLNSTLSARIEELNAQISSLYVENLRLRASEIALTSQLKKEKDKSRKILADAESAVRRSPRRAVTALD